MGSRQSAAATAHDLKGRWLALQTSHVRSYSPAPAPHVHIAPKAAQPKSRNSRKKVSNHVRSLDFRLLATEFSFTYQPSCHVRIAPGYRRIEVLDLASR